MGINRAAKHILLYHVTARVPVDENTIPSKLFSLQICIEYFRSGHVWLYSIHPREFFNRICL
jgi:hypothetical protein